MSRVSQLPSGESSFNIYELLSVKENLLIKRSLKKKMAHKQQDVLLAKTYPQRHENQAICLLTCPSKGKAIFTSYPIQAQVILKRLLLIIYQNYATQSQGAHDISKQALLNILKCSEPYMGYFHNKNVLIAYQRKVQSHSQCINYKPYTSLRYKSIFIIKYKIYIQISYMFVLYKMQIVSTNHDSTNSKWPQYN